MDKKKKRSQQDNKKMIMRILILVMVGAIFLGFVLLPLLNF